MFVEFEDSEQFPCVVAHRDINGGEFPIVRVLKLVFRRRGNLLEFNDHPPLQTLVQRIVIVKVLADQLRNVGPDNGPLRIVDLDAHHLGQEGELFPYALQRGALSA